MSLNYNTKNKPLVFREYGRNIHRLVHYAITLEDRGERTQLAHHIVNLMGQMHPHLRNIEEFRQKLWYQLHAIADFKLDIDGPYVKPLPEEVWQKAVYMPYPQSRIRYKHYGKNVLNLIKKAVVMEDEDKKIAFAKVIANYMKMVHKNWSNDLVSEELIKEDLFSLSEGRIDLRREDNLDMPKTNRKRKRHNTPPTTSNNYHKRNKNYR